jgi:hypothetical protein
VPSQISSDFWILKHMQGRIGEKKKNVEWRRRERTKSTKNKFETI